MSDTTITAEERAELRELSAICDGDRFSTFPEVHTFSPLTCADKDGQITAQILDDSIPIGETFYITAAYIAAACNMAPRLLTALETTEAEMARLREQNKRLQQKCKSLANNAVTDDDLQQIMNTAERAPGGFAKEHEYGAINVIGKAQLSKDLTYCIRLEDLSFFSGAKATIRKLVDEASRLRQQEAARRAVEGEPS